MPAQGKVVKFYYSSVSRHSHVFYVFSGITLINFSMRRRFIAQHPKTLEMNLLKQSLSLLLAAAQILIIRSAVAQVDPTRSRRPVDSTPRIAPPIGSRRTTPVSPADSTPSRLPDTLFLQPVEVRALRAGERAPGIPALALQSLARAVGRENHVTVIVGIKVSLDVRLLLGVCRANRIGTALGGFERVRNNKRDVLTVIPNHMILKRRTSLSRQLRLCARPRMPMSNTLSGPRYQM